MENSAFTITQILSEINYGECQSSKNAIFEIERYAFVTFQPPKNAKLHKNQNSEPLNVSKRQILHL